MPFDSSEQPRRGEPLFSAPILVIGLSLLLVALHGATFLLDDRSYVELQYNYALVPRRFWQDGQFAAGYPNLFDALVTLVTTGFLHANWLHVLVNAAMLLAFGTQVQRTLGTDRPGMLKFLAVYFGSVIGGSIGYLALVDVTAPAAVGASGGTSGLMAAAFLVNPSTGRLVSPLSRGFLVMTFAFALANVALMFAGPSLVGSGIAWQAHAGGYIAGALLMMVLARPKRPPELAEGPA
jgi:membrane associated rhomboid family serine protease